MEGLDLDRRKFVSLGLASPLIVGGAFLAPAQNSHALLPLFATFVLGGIARRTVARSVAGSAVRSNTARTLSNGGVANSGARAGQNTTRSFLFKGFTPPLGLSTGLTYFVSPQVYIKAIRYNARAIWITSGLTNNFDLNFRNMADQTINGELALFLRNVETGKITDKVHAGELTALPSSNFTFGFQIDELPYSGVINLVAHSTTPHLVAEQSGNIIVASADDIFFETV